VSCNIHINNDNTHPHTHRERERAVLVVLEEERGGKMHWKLPQLLKQGMLVAINLDNVEVNVVNLLFDQL
jgi:hypothetical protein